MSLAVVHTRALAGLAAPEVRVEVHVGNGLPAFYIVGLPQAAVRESADRVRAARFPALLPPLSDDDALECATVRSIARKLQSRALGRALVPQPAPHRVGRGAGRWRQRAAS